MKNIISLFALCTAFLIAPVSHADEIALTYIEGLQTPESMAARKREPGWTPAVEEMISKLAREYAEPTSEETLIKRQKMDVARSECLQNLDELSLEIAALAERREASFDIWMKLKDQFGLNNLAVKKEDDRISLIDRQIIQKRLDLQNSVCRIYSLSDDKSSETRDRAFDLKRDQVDIAKSECQQTKDQASSEVSELLERREAAFNTWVDLKEKLGTNNLAVKKADDMITVLDRQIIATRSKGANLDCRIYTPEGGMTTAQQRIESCINLAFKIEKDDKEKRRASNIVSSAGKQLQEAKARVLRFGFINAAIIEAQRNLDKAKTAYQMADRTLRETRSLSEAHFCP